MAEASWLRSRWAEDRLRDYFLLHGYEVLAPPILEYTELFLRKSGGQLASRMYTLNDPGGNLVSMRPEFTCSIIRHLVEEDDWVVPKRLQYCGPVFRYEVEQRGLRQFTQVGAELLGVGGPAADAEGLALASGALGALGLKDVRLTLGDISVHRALLEACGLSERAIAFVLSALPDLAVGADAVERAWQQADKLGLLASGEGTSQLPALVREMNGPDARELLKGMLELSGADEGTVGQRTPDEVVDRMLRKAQAADDPVRLKRGMEAAKALAAVKGPPAQAMPDARSLLREYGADIGHLDQLARSLELLEGSGTAVREVRLDFGLARELAYYTGIIFEITSGEEGGSLGGGGRYDGLARALGSPVDLPALGFAYSLETVLEAVPVSSRDQSSSTEMTYIWPTGDAAYGRALTLASGLRSEGSPVVLEVSPRDLVGAIAFARSHGYPFVLAVDADGTTTTHSAS